MKTNFKKIRRLYPLHRNVIMRHVDRLVRDFESLDDDRRREYIAEIRDAVTEFCMFAFRDAIKAGALPQVVMSDLVAEVQRIERRLQDLAPSVALAGCVEDRLGELLMAEVEEPSTSKDLQMAAPMCGRPVETAAPIDGNWLREHRGDTAQTAFARWCKISTDTLQRAECGAASPRTIRKIERFLKRSTGQTIKVKKPEKKEPQETART